MLKRKINNQILDFLHSSEKKCLMVQGARQVGKTFSVDEIGKNKENAESYISINFLKQPQLKEIFKGNLDVDSLLLNFSVFMPAGHFVPDKTLLFLDEIQECPEAITSLKFWAEDQRFKVIASGSMLGIDYNRPTSYPVGFIHYLDMFPLDFEEFLWALGIQDNVINILHKCFQEHTAVANPVNQQMMNYLKLYMIIGGMPEAVQKYVETHNIEEADKIQRSILRDYRFDIAHYAPPEIKIKAEDCYFSLPDQLTKQNHKFQYSVVSKGGNARKYENSMDWLVNADLVYPCKNVSVPQLPLRNFAMDDNFRVYPSDIGLLVSMFDYTIKSALLSENNHALGLAKGGIYEALIADMLLKGKNRNLYFYKNDALHMEIEFLLSGNDGIIPVEVKAGGNKSRSLDRILAKDDIPYGYKLISGNAGKEGKKITLPLYMAMFL